MSFEENRLEKPFSIGIDRAPKEQSVADQTAREMTELESAIKEVGNQDLAEQLLKIKESPDGQIGELSYLLNLWGLDWNSFSFVEDEKIPLLTNILSKWREAQSSKNIQGKKAAETEIKKLLQ